MEDALKNYRDFVARVDELCAGITNILGAQITCFEGCADCCKAISIFPVEAAAIAEELKSLTETETTAIRHRAAEHGEDGRCSLLFDNRCSLYKSRPIICRTHGLPILFTENDNRRLDYCPLNLTKEEKSLPGSAVIDLDRLNTVLVAINSLYIKQSGASPDFPERLTIAEALLEHKR